MWYVITIGFPLRHGSIGYIKLKGRSWGAGEISCTVLVYITVTFPNQDASSSRCFYNSKFMRYSYTMRTEFVFLLNKYVHSSVEISFRSQNWTESEL